MAITTSSPPSQSPGGTTTHPLVSEGEAANRLFSNELKLAVEVASDKAERLAEENSEGMTDAELARFESGQALAANGKALPTLPAVQQGEGVTAEIGDEPPAVTLAEAVPSLQSAATDVNSLAPTPLNVAADAVARQVVVTTVVPANANSGQPLVQRDQPHLATNVANLMAADGVESVVDKSAKSDQVLAELSRNLRQSLGAARSGEVPATITSGPLSPDSGLSAFQLASAAVRDAAPGASSALPRFMATVETPFNDPRWQGDFNHRIALFAKSGIQQAEIKMNPAHLGPIDIRISMNDDQQASITFVAKNAAVREAIEASMPRLREMLNGQGMDLTDSGVSEHPFSEQRGQSFQQTEVALDNEDRPSTDGVAGEGVATALPADGATITTAEGVWGVDYYA